MSVLVSCVFSVRVNDISYITAAGTVISIKKAVDIVIQVTVRVLQRFSDDISTKLAEFTVTFVNVIVAFFKNTFYIVSIKTRAFF